MNKSSRLKWWEIVFLILGSPIWATLVIALIAVIFSLYISLWSVIISLWAVFVSFLASGFALLVAGILFALFGKSITGFTCLGIGFVCAGLSIFMFFGCKVATKGILMLTKKMAIGIKNCFVRRSA